VKRRSRRARKYRTGIKGIQNLIRDPKTKAPISPKKKKKKTTRWRKNAGKKRHDIKRDGGALGGKGDCGGELRTKITHKRRVEWGMVRAKKNITPKTGKDNFQEE